MVASEKGHSVSVSHFECKQEEECFYAVSASVDVVSQEDVVGVGRVSANFEEFKDVIKLSVDVATNGDRRPDSDSVRFVLKNFFGGFT